MTKKSVGVGPTGKMIRPPTCQVNKTNKITTTSAKDSESRRRGKLEVLGKLGNLGESVFEVLHSEFPIWQNTQHRKLQLKTSECSLRHFDQTPRFSNSEFSILHYTQNGKLGVENFRVFIRFTRTTLYFIQLCN